ncbi:hypothetical protein PR001_g25837, partial [Phytophthora rubi]
MLKRRRQAHAEDAIIEDNVTKMLQAGVIEEGNGAWGFPVVLVRKKDGEVRFCIDYRALNKITKRDVYPLPRIDETLEALGGARLFTTLDLKSGYWQIGVAPEDRDKTAFTTKKGLYRFVRMPFGLMNAPSTFQRMMNGVLRGLTWSTCLVYLDDIVVYTCGGIERHVVELATVMERLVAAGLTLKLKKCVFAATAMEYLGHELSSEGVRPVERLVTAVQEFPRPLDPVEVKRFMHLAGYYRKFIAAFGSIVAPMTRLLKKDSEWEWTEDQEFVFERVKAALTTRPLLAYPNFKLPFRLVTDASTTGLGACLMQDQGRGWQPLAFASKVNSSAEANYSITELECLAVVWSVKLFRPYLYGRAFTIITDHSALKWLMTWPNLAGRLHRWSLTLQEYEFEILYRPGATNVVADALSRATAVVKVAAGRKSKRGRPDSEHETKAEAGELPPTAEVKEAEEYAKRMAGKPAAVIIPDEVMAVSGTADARTPVTAPADAAAAPVATGAPGGDQPHAAVDHGNDELTHDPSEGGTNTLIRTGNRDHYEQSSSDDGWSVDTRRQEATAETQPKALELDSSAGEVVPTATRRRPTTKDGTTWASGETTNHVGHTGGCDNGGGGDRGRRLHGWIPRIRHEYGGSRASDGVSGDGRGRKERSSQRPAMLRGASKQGDDRKEGQRASDEQVQNGGRRTTVDGGPRPVTPTPAATSVGDAGPVLEETLQLADDEIDVAQQRSRVVQKLVEAGLVSRNDVVFKEMHGSVWAGHLRGPHTYGRVAQLYWWPNLQREV